MAASPVEGAARSGTGRRVAAYSAAAVVVAGLVWAGWVRDVDADPGTLLACATTQLELAHGVRGEGPDARQTRDALLAQAESFIVRAEAAMPGHPSVLVARGDLCNVRGDREGALRQYELAATAEQCSAEGAALVRLRRAEILLEQGRSDAALRELDRVRDAGSSRFETRREVIAVQALEASGDRDRARSALDALAARGDIESSIVAGELLAERDLDDAAERAFRAAWVPSQLADYYVARLKLVRGQFDICLELLNRAVAHDRLEILALVQRDREIWAAVKDRAEFGRLWDVEVAAPR